MSRRVHVYSASLGRSFTFDEWVEYLRQHPNSSSEIVTECGEFGYNVHGVCMNPHRVIIHATSDNSKRYGDIASVSVAQSPCGAWSFACDATSDISSPHFVTDTSKPWCFKTENEAIYAGLCQLEKKLMQDRHWVEQMEEARAARDGDDEDREEKNRNSSRLAKIKRLLKGTREKMDYYDPRQMLLF